MSEIEYACAVVSAMNIGHAVIGAMLQFGAKLPGTVKVMEPSLATATLRAATKPPIKTVSVAPSSSDATPVIVTLVPTLPLAGEIVAPLVEDALPGGVGGIGGNIGPPGWNGSGCPGGTTGSGMPGQWNSKKLRVSGPKKPVALEEAAMPLETWKLARARAVIGPKKPVISAFGKLTFCESIACNCVTSLPCEPIERLRLNGWHETVLEGTHGIVDDGTGINGGTLIGPPGGIIMLLDIFIVLDAPKRFRNAASWLNSAAICASREAAVAEPETVPEPEMLRDAGADWADTMAGDKETPTTATAVITDNKVIFFISLLYHS